MGRVCSKCYQSLTAFQSSINMAFIKVCALLVLATAAYGSPAFWKGTELDSTVEEMRSLCANDDAIACLKFRAMSFLDTIFKKDNYQVL